MFGKILAICIFLLATPSALSQNCGDCMSNFVACVNETSFQLCPNNTLHDGIYNCPANQICTNSTEVCGSNTDDTIVSVCGAGGGTVSGTPSGNGCSTCTGEASGTYICVSSTQFAICTGSGSESNPLPCPTGEFCSEDLVTKNNLKVVCAPQVVMDWMKVGETCPNVGEVTVSTRSTEATTGLPPDELTNQCEQANETASYFKIPNPIDCKAYIYCERNSFGGFLSIDMRCRTGEIYSETQKKCIPGNTCN